MVLLFPASKNWKKDSNPVKPATSNTALRKQHLPKTPATDINLMERGQMKTLGVGWNPQIGTVKFTLKDLGISWEFTKRWVLLKISQICDPLRLASAVTFWRTFKAFLSRQKTFRLTREWLHLKEGYHSASTCPLNQRNMASKSGWQQIRTMALCQIFLFTLDKRQTDITFMALDMTS